MEVITTTTLIPIGTAVTVLVAVVGGSRWLSSIHDLARRNKEKIGSMEIELSSMQAKHDNIFQRLSSIEAKMDIILKQIIK